MIGQYFPPDFGGASTRAYNLARGLVLQNCQVTVITSFPHYPDGNIPENYSGKFVVKEEIDGIKVIRTTIPKLAHSTPMKRTFLHISFIISVLFALRHVKNIDIIFSMNPNFFAFFPALFCKFIFKKKIIRNVDDLWPEVFYDLGLVKSKFIKKILNYITRKSYEIPVALILVSNGYVNTIIKNYKIPAEKIHVIEQGVDLEKFSNIKFSPKSNSKTIMYSGALNLGYDFKTVLRSAKLLESKSITFVIRGTGESSEEIQRIISQEKIKNVKFDTTLLSNEELLLTLSSADIFLLPMSSSKIIDHGLPTKIMEYQALGKPILCISNGEAGRYIEETKSGLVTKSRDPKEFANLIMKLIDNENLASELGKNGFLNAKNNLTLDIIGKKTLSIIMNL